MTEYVQGIRRNSGQFTQQLVQVFFVGLTIGMQRTVVPALAESEFGVEAGSAMMLMAFVVSLRSAATHLTGPTVGPGRIHLRRCSALQIRRSASRPVPP